MLQVTKDKDEIIIQEIPVAQWFYALIPAAMLLLITFLGIGKLTDSLTLAAISGISAAITAFLLYLLFNPSITTKINKQGKTISVRKRSPIKYNFDIYSFNEIADSIYVSEYKDSNFQTNYQIIMPLTNGQKIELSNQMRMNSAEYFDAADLMNSYIFNTSKQLSAKAMAWKLKKTAN